MRVGGWLAGKRAVTLGRRSNAERSAQEAERCRQGCSPRPGSGGAVLLVNDAAEDVTASDRAAVGSGDGVGDWLGELQATVWSRLVVVADVLVEHRLEMSS